MGSFGQRLIERQSYDSIIQQYAQHDIPRLLQLLPADERAKITRKIEWQAITRKDASFDAGPLLWLTQFTKTEDEHWLAKGTPPVAPFPVKQYFADVVKEFIEREVVAVWKSREMMTSWLGCGLVTWMTSTMPISWLLQSEQDEKAMQLVNYCRILHENQDEWLKARNPLIVNNDHELIWKRGGRIKGVAQGANQVRSYHPFGYLQDESAFLPEAEACFNAARPVCKKIIMISSDNMGWFHTLCKGAV